MPITARKPEKTFKEFRDSIRWLIQKTLRTPSHVRLGLTVTGLTAYLEFQRGDGIPTAIPLKTNVGEVFFALYQLLEAVPESGEYRLTTKEYAYRLLPSAEPTADAVIRWEYCAAAPKDSWCRHHIQMPFSVPLGDGSLNLNRVHAPTGWVTIEEIVRFLINDLGVPPASEDWPLAIAKSEN